MVQLTIKIRPQRGYTLPHAIKEITVDSSERLETILASLKLGKKGMSVFIAGASVPLNSSLATHNVKDGEILETCSSPLLSCVLSAVISDLEAVQKIEEDEDRTQERIKPLLDNVTLDEPRDWVPSRWAFEHVKRRSICLKTMKNVIQQSGRFANFEVPQCTDWESLHAYLKTAFSSDKGGASSIEQCFKPSARNRDGKPTLAWELLEQKLEKFVRFSATTVAPDGDYIEPFVVAENARNRTEVAGYVLGGASLPSTPNRRKSASSNRPRRQQRRLPDSATSDQAELQCGTCNKEHADFLCLDNASCPFFKIPSCAGCFGANHPPMVRAHEPIACNDARAKAVLKQTKKKAYCPEYLSGGYSILVALFEAQSRGQLSLTEDRIRELAQPNCRSNLYDRQARGRSAFSAAETITEKGLIRKEIVPGQEQDIAKYSLLPDGEEMASFCAEFSQSVNSVTQVKDDNRTAVQSAARHKQISIVVDKREDKTFAARLTKYCDAQGVDFKRENLPAGDYLFTAKKGNSDVDMVLPLVIERKTWSDLADSVKGKGRRRLDCVGIGRESSCDQKCQLCRMKRSKCGRIMFIIEGARCLSRDGQEGKCGPQKSCKYCTELQERHGHTIVQLELEKVLYKLQSEHNCLIHFTRGYNETITSLFLIRGILGSSVDIGGPREENDVDRAIRQSLSDSGNCSAPDVSHPLDLTYQQFCSNALRKSRDTDEVYNVPARGDIVEWADEKFVKEIFTGKVGDTLRLTFGRSKRHGGAETEKNMEDSNQAAAAATATVLNIDSDDDEAELWKTAEESQDSIQILDGSEWTSAKSKAVARIPSPEIEIIDGEDEPWEEVQESQSSIQVLEDTGWTHAKPKARAKGPSSDEMHTGPNSAPLSEDVQILESVGSRNLKTASTGTISSTRKRKLAEVDTTISSRATKRTTTGETKTRLFLISGLYEYDTEYHKDANKLWKHLYFANRDEKTNFKPRAQEQMRTIQQSQMPFVEREAILYWMLYLQLRYSVLLHVVRQRSCATDIKVAWCRPESQQKTHSMSTPTPSSTDPLSTRSPNQSYARLASSTPPSSTPRLSTHCSSTPRSSTLRSSTPRSSTPASERECIICTNKLGTIVDALPCGHCFHTHCIQQWFEGKSKRHCPICNFRVGAPKDDNVDGTRVITASTRAPSIEDSSTAATLREARVRRFESRHLPVGPRRAIVGRRPASASRIVDNDSIRPMATWKCDTCTFENASTTSICTMCEFPRASPSQPAAVAKHTTTATESSSTQWPCDSCTMLNNADLVNCDVCGAPNPFQVADKEFPSNSYGTPISKPRPQAAVSTSFGATSSSTRNVRCGACGQNGHNRGTATADNCPLYHTDDEAKRRQKKKVEAQRKARDAGQRAELLRQENERVADQMRAAETALANLQRTQVNRTAMTTNELRRLQRAKERAERRALKFDET